MSPPVADSTKDVDQVEKKQAQRRINKPLIEKRRRARINECLGQLKSIVLEASDTTKSPRPSKLEKADILEMTVDFIKKRLTTTTAAFSHGDKNSVDSPNQEPVNEYIAGYSKCVDEISRFLEQSHTVNETIKHDVVTHISRKLNCKHSSDSSSQQKVRPLSKIPIIPIKKRKMKIETDHDAEVIDLSVKEDNGSKSDIIEQPLNLSRSSDNTENIRSISNDKLPSAQVPVGLLCGGQIMLLVQVPPSVTSQQFLTQNITSQLDLQNLKNAGLIQTQTIPSNHTSVLPTFVKAEPIENRSEITMDLSEQSTSLSSELEEKHECENQTDCVPNSSVINNGNQKSVAISGRVENHWRPW